MDDIICPECGRPNLPEANKCWYCQTELTGVMNEQADNMTSVAGETDSISSPSDIEPAIEETKEDIPDWLAKIRQKIEAERGPDEELPFWKQKDIFGGERKIDAKTQKEKRAQKVTGKKPGKPDGKNSEEEIIDTSEPDHNDGMDDLSNDLPEGFTKL
jgi:hypothetical protein